MKLFGIEFAPLDVPLERRLQTAVICAHVFNAVMAPGISTMLLFYTLFFTSYWWISLGYIAWIFYDIKIARTHQKGGRRSEWLRRSPHMTLYRDYFPISMHKTVDLEPTKNYILGTHPHGVLAASSICNFASEATGFDVKFPGITSYLLTLEVNLCWPINRAYALWMGVCDVSKESIKYILTKQGKGNACVIVVGGAAEALEAQPGNYNVVLLQRKGFIKIALQTGSSLVPVFNFGENDLYHQAANPPGSLIRKFQDKFKSVMGFSPPFFYGRGVFNYTFGFIPYRKPINTVVGAPIDVPHIAEPTNEEVSKYHKIYMDNLSDLFENHKTKYGIHEDIHLTFV